MKNIEKIELFLIVLKFDLWLGLVTIYARNVHGVTSSRLISNFPFYQITRNFRASKVMRGKICRLDLRKKIGNFFQPVRSDFHFLVTSTPRLGAFLLLKDNFNVYAALEKNRVIFHTSARFRAFYPPK